MIYCLLFKGHLCPVADCNMDGVRVKAIPRAEGEQKKKTPHNVGKNTPEMKKFKVNKFKAFKLVRRYTKYLNIRIHPNYLTFF